MLASNPILIAFIDPQVQSGVPFQRLSFLLRGNGRVARGHGPALALDKCERGQVLIGTPPHSEDRPYPGAGGSYAIDN